MSSIKTEPGETTEHRPHLVMSLSIKTEPGETTEKSPHLVMSSIKTGPGETTKQSPHLVMSSIKTEPGETTEQSPHLVMLLSIKTEPGKTAEGPAPVTQHCAGLHKHLCTKIEVCTTKCGCSVKSEEVLLHKAQGLNSVVPKTHAHEEKVTKYVCRLCIKDFGDAASLGYHIQAIHPSEYVTRNIARKHSARHCRSVGVDQSLYGCHLCLKIFGDAASLGEHVCAMHSGKVTQQEIEWASNLEMPASKARVKPCHCPLCPEVFLSKSSFEGHIQTSHSETACCEEVGPSTSKHWRNVERMPGTPKKFHDRNTRWHHRQNAHTATGEKHSRRQTIYPCEHCSKTFHRKSNLTQHLLTHPGGASLQCHLCPAVFSQKEGLIRHLHGHRGGEKPFGCPHCVKRFLINAKMLIHLKTHTGEQPYTCDYCPAKFSVHDNLWKHVATHAAIKPSVCPRCPQRFARVQDLKRHYCIHTGERPFACATCPKTFTRGNLLRDHMEAVHRPLSPQSETSTEHSAMET